MGTERTDGLIKLTGLSLAPFEEQTIPGVLVYVGTDGKPIYKKVTEEIRQQKLTLLR